LRKRLARWAPCSWTNSHGAEIAASRNRGSASEMEDRTALRFFHANRHRHSVRSRKSRSLHCPLFFRYLRFDALGVLPGSRGYSESIFAGP
jgi:hypothetical protein